MASLFGWLWLEGRRRHGGVYLSVLNSEAFGRVRRIMKRPDFVVHLVFLQHGTLATLHSAAFHEIVRCDVIDPSKNDATLCARSFQPILIDPLLLFTSLEWLQAT